MSMEAPTILGLRRRVPRGPSIMLNAPNLPKGHISLAISPVWSAEVLTLGGWGASFVAGEGVSQGANTP